MGETLASKTPSVNCTFSSCLPAHNPFTFSLYPTDASEIFNYLRDLDNSATQGDDCLPANVVRAAAHVLAHPLSVIINHSFTFQNFLTH